MAPVLNAQETEKENNKKMQQETDRKQDVNRNIVQGNGSTHVDVITGNQKENKGVDGLFSGRDERKLTEIQKFYDGKNVMITGATGFLGKVLMEKLLRSCPGVENIYLLVRQKKGKDIHTRIDEIFDDPLYESLKEEMPKFRHKVVVMEGNCEAPGLGLSLGDRQILTEKVNIVFHVAATVKFDERLRTALATNVAAVLHMLKLVRDMKHLNVCMHVSTAYSNSNLREILVREQFYPFDASYEQLAALIDGLTDEQINQMLPKILGTWPNTYTFTKALAEKEIRNAGNLPLGIFRPGAVTAMMKEPLVGWVDNVYGPNGVIVAAARGMLHTLRCDGATTAGIVPVDMVVNSLIVAAANVHKSYNSSSPPMEPPIFNYAGSGQNRITWGGYAKLSLASIEDYPSSDAVWHTFLAVNKSAFMHYLYITFLHLLPAGIMDAAAVCVGRKPKMLKMYRGIHKFTSTLTYFITREIQFCDSNVREMWSVTTEEDKKIFPFDMRAVNWEQYFHQYLIGLRRFVLKESDETLPQARIRWRRLYYLHQLIKLILYASAGYALSSAVSKL